MRIIFSLLFLLFLTILAMTGCTRTRAGENSDLGVPSPTPIEQSMGAASVAPRDPHDGRVVGESAEVIINPEGEERAPRPRVWLEYSIKGTESEPSDKPIRIDLSHEAEDLLDDYWRFLFDIPKKKPDLLEIVNAKLRTIASLKEIKVKTPQGERTFSDYEAEDLVNFVQDAFDDLMKKRLSRPDTEPSN